MSCTYVVQWAPSIGSAGSGTIAGFRAVLVLFSGIGALFLALKLKRARESHPALHAALVFLCAVSLLAVAALYVVGSPNDKSPNSTSTAFVFDVAYVLILGGQWWVQVAVAVSFFSRDLAGKALQQTAFKSTLLTVGLMAVPALALAVKCRTCGVLIVEGMLSIAFLIILLSRQLFSRGSRPRPASRSWAAFQLTAHVLFGVEALLQILNPMSEASACLTVVSDAVNYALYAPVLWFVLRADARCWREVGARHAATTLHEGLPLLFTTNLVNADSTSSSNSSFSVQTTAGPYDAVRKIEWDRLNIDRLVGAGTFADVYKGQYRSEQVAIKRLKLPVNATSGQNNRIVAALVRETKLLAQLDHLNVLKLVGVVAEPDRLAIITEYCSKGALFDIIHAATGEFGAGAHGSQIGNAAEAETLVSANDKKSGNIQVRDSQKLRSEWDLRMRLLLDACSGMAYLHAREPKIIHRDLKSHNLLVTGDWQAKVADLGLSRTKEITQTMTSLGTPQWMAPEVLMSNKYSESCDIFSMAVVMWEMVAMEAPWKTLMPAQVIAQVSIQRARLPIPSFIPPKLDALIRSCWDSRPEHRPSFAALFPMLVAIRSESQGLALPKSQLVGE